MAYRDFIYAAHRNGWTNVNWRGEHDELGCLKNPAAIPETGFYGQRLARKGRVLRRLPEMRIPFDDLIVPANRSSVLARRRTIGERTRALLSTWRGTRLVMEARAILSVISIDDVEGKTRPYRKCTASFAVAQEEVVHGGIPAVNRLLAQAYEIFERTMQTLEREEEKRDTYA